MIRNKLQFFTFFFLATLSALSQMIQTSGPIGGRFTHIALIQKTWTEISAGPHHVLAIDNEGHLWGCGRNDYGQIDGNFSSIVYEPTLIDSTRKWVSVASGGLHSLGVDEEGNLYSWGNGERGQLGNDSTSIFNSIPQQIGNDKDWWQVSARVNHTIALKTDSTMWGWGQNFYYQLGDRGNTDQLTPKKLNDKKWKYISAVVGHTLAINEFDDLWAWGLNSEGQLGDSSINDRSVPVKIKSNYRFESASTGYSFSVAISNNTKTSIFENFDNISVILEDNINLLVYSSVDANPIIAIYDLSGQQVSNEYIPYFYNGDYHLYNLSELSNGFFIVVVNTSKTVKSFKFLKVS